MPWDAGQPDLLQTAHSLLPGSPGLRRGHPALPPEPQSTKEPENILPAEMAETLTPFLTTCPLASGLASLNLSVLFGIQIMASTTQPH